VGKTLGYVVGLIVGEAVGEADGLPLGLTVGIIDGAVVEYTPNIWHVSAGHPPELLCCVIQSCPLSVYLLEYESYFAQSASE